MEPPPLPGSPNVYPTSSFSYVDSKTPLKNIDQVRGKLDYETGVVKYWNHKLMKVEKKLVDLNGPLHGKDAFFRDNKEEARIEHLKSMISEGHQVATYVYGAILVCHREVKARILELHDDNATIKLCNNYGSLQDGIRK
ncbi:hypothetical protein C1H46_005856 [Malus baccata]|uniref:At2g35280-like TPR domain-containing protein n=1 Tax=Malus baccata TaxID=106549 RepID=A0A540NDH4_MALBA|nr:hypothetical protein C1H46_005856 [Malus baccata]